MKKLLLFLTGLLCTIGTWADDSYVASVTIGDVTTNYTDMSAAFTAVNVAGQTSTLKLLSDRYTPDGGSQGESYVTLTAGNITVDLNGKEFVAGDYETAIKVDGANVTIDGTGFLIGYADYANTLKYCSGNLTVKSGCIEGMVAALRIASTVTNPARLCGGTFIPYEKGTYHYAIYVEGDGKTISNSINIDGYYFADTDSKEMTIGANQTVISNNVKVMPVTDDNSVASVTINGTTNKYVSLYSASMASAKGTATVPATLTVLKDVTCNENFSFTSGTVTMDLNGKTITGDQYVILTVDGADITITDNTTDKAGGIVSTVGKAIAAVSGKLTIYAGTFTGAKNYAGLDVMKESAIVTLYGGRYITGNASSSTSGITQPYNVGMNVLATGYCFWDNDNNPLTYDATHTNVVNSSNSIAVDIKVAQLTEENALASVTIGDATTLYTSFTDAVAVAAVDGTTATVKLLRDVTAKSIAFTAGTVTLDLNGKTLSGYSKDEIIKLSDNADLTITDNSTDKKGTIENTYTSNGYAINFIAGKLAINAGTFIAGVASLYAGGASMTAIGLITLTGGYFKKNGTYAIELPYENAAMGPYPTVNWDIISMDGYYFKGDDGNPVVSVSYIPQIRKNVVVTAIPTEPQNITLNETSEMDNVPAIVSSFTYNLTMKRSMKIGHWNSVCLPFSMTAAEIETACGSGTKIMHIKDITSDDVVELEDATAIDADEFYIVKPTKAVTEIKLDGKKINYWDIYRGCEKEFTSGYSISSLNYSVVLGSMEGYFSEYVLSNDKLCYVAQRNYGDSDDTGVTLKGYRWSIGIYSYGSYGSGAKSLTTNVELTDTATSIHSIDTDVDNNASAYNLAGQRVGNGAKGIIIKNGKKIMVK